MLQKTLQLSGIALLLIISIGTVSHSNSQMAMTETARTVYVDNGTLRVGIDKNWGGAIRELWYQGANFINNYDGGRLIAISVYDGDDGYNQENIHDPFNWGWNPTPSDKYDHTNQPQEIRLEGDTLYVRSRNLQWNPDDKGGGQFAGVASDLVVESWLSFMPQYPRVLEVRYRVTYDGSEDHTVTRQEFPFVYVNSGYNQILSYTGSNPWTSEPVDSPNTNGLIAASENWLAFADVFDTGVAIYAPYNYPLFTAIRHNEPPAIDDTNYAVPFMPQAYEQNSVFETTIYLVAGDWRDARDTISALHDDLEPFADLAPPTGTLDRPTPNAMLSGESVVAGWAIDNEGVERVEVLVDGTPIGEATYGLGRSDVAADYPGLPGVPDFGFRYELDVDVFAPGQHELEIIITDQAGNSTVIGPRLVVF